MLVATRVRRREQGRLLLGGTPRRLLRLTDAGARIAERLLAGEPTRTDVERQFGRRLTAAGLARAYPPAGPRPSVTVIVPVRDRPELLARCLDAVGDRDPVVVVDDGSRDPGPIAVAAGRPHVRLVRRPSNGGPAAARLSGLGGVDSDVVAFLDSDVVVGPGWLDPLLAHLADPSVAAVAPRVRPTPAPAVLGRFLAARSPLDLGADDVPVGPGSPVAYVPTAALVVRRPLASFDPALRYGEDVDLVWRLVAAGHQVRYEPRVTVAHTEPTTWRATLLRRHRYGTSAGPLDSRHPGATAPLRTGPLPALAVAAALALPAPAALAVVGASTLAGSVRLHRAGLPRRDAAVLAVQAAGYAALGAGRLAAQLGGPLAWVAARRRTRLGVLLAAPAAVEWVRRRPTLDPVTYVALSLLDDAAYGAGVWRGALAARTARPLLPRLR